MPASENESELGRSAHAGRRIDRRSQMTCHGSRQTQWEVTGYSLQRPGGKRLTLWWQN